MFGNYDPIACMFYIFINFVSNLILYNLILLLSWYEKIRYLGISHILIFVLSATFIEFMFMSPLVNPPAVLIIINSSFIS